MTRQSVLVQSICTIMFAAGYLVAFDAVAQDKPTKGEPLEVMLARVPEMARTTRNPLENDPEVMAAGQKLFDQHCAGCHGRNAKGTRRGANLRIEEPRRATPGEIFWLITNGVVRHGMPEWSKLPEAQRWQITAFLTRTLGTVK